MSVQIRFFFLFIIIALFLVHQTVVAQNLPKGPSGLPLPRFVTIKSNKTNLRVGPSKDYPVSWMYLKSGLPVEIIQEYDSWRRIRDVDGTEGWVNQWLLSGQRSALVAPWLLHKHTKKIYIDMYKEANKTSRIIAKLEPGVLLKINECNGNWCEGRSSDIQGWIEQNKIWGAYPGEVFK
ncbi:aspartyl-tRNA synthetase [Liberibacter crescens]|nr:aspartyl-tRNA synthetase [Liberibacter crescens]